MTKKRRPTKLRRFILFATLLGILAASIAFGMRLYQARRQEAAREAIVAYLTRGAPNDGAQPTVRFYFDYEIDSHSGKHLPDAQLPKPRWLIDLLGIDFFADVVDVAVSTKDAKRRIDHRVLKELSKLTRLRSLVVDTSISDEALQPCKDLRHLELVGINSPRVTDKGLACFQNTRRLKSLDFSLTRVTGSGFRQFSKKLALVDLELSGTRVDDGGLSELSKFKNLRRLILSDTPISDVGIMKLSSLVKLETLDIRSTKVSQEVISLLAKHLPKCHIMSDEGDYLHGRPLGD